MREFFYTATARVREMLRRDRGDTDFDAELEAHLAVAEAEKVRRGLDPDQARREARLELGGVAQVREAARAARSLPWLDAFSLDGKLGVRMLRKSWGLTLVGGLAMAITIGLGASIFTIWNAFAGTRLPLHEGDRIVAIQPFDRGAQRVRRATPLSDFRRWRNTLTTVEQVSGMRALNRTVITPHGPAGSVSTAEMTASAFRLARVQPLLGRPLIDQDERDDGELVAVIGYELWRSEFSSDPGVIGRRIQVGDVPHTVIGVMPEGFRFPLNQRLWTPLRSKPAGDGDAGAFVFARLIPGATLERARAEVTALGFESREATLQLQPRVVPYAAGVFPEVHDNRWGSAVMFLLGALLLIPPCTNIAILVYARTVRRRDEFAARVALGASRGRIVMQLFVEVLVLAAGAGAVGYLLARQFSARLSGIVVPASPDRLPFWMDFTPSFTTVLCVAGLSVLAAAIAGAVPAWHATGRWRQAGLTTLRNRGIGARLGKTWTTLLATQVALSLAILPSAIEMTWGIFQPAIAGPKLPVEQFLTGWLVTEGETSRFEILRREAIRGLEAAPGISGVTASAAVLMEEPFADIEVEGANASDEQARFNSVDQNYFDVFAVRLLAGRKFDARDFGAAAAAVIVNRTFVQEILEEASVLGRRVRYLERDEMERPVNPSPWYEIVGVVDDFPGTNDGPVMYHPMTRAVHPVSLTVRAPSGVGVAAERMRSVSSSLDANLRVGRLQSLTEIYWRRRSLDHMVGFVLGTVMVIVLLFSMAGIYTLMAFILAQRWQEIGLRSALGAQPRRLVAGVFGRAMVPLVLGAIAGCALALALGRSLPITEAGGERIPGIVSFTALLMIVAGLLAVAGPARRAIRVNPTDVLRVG